MRTLSLNKKLFLVQSGGFLMRLQIALDTLTSSEGVALVELMEKDIDIIEIGTPLIIREGVSAVAKFKNAFPDKKVLADLKIMDAGEYESTEAYEAMADIVTVLGVSHDTTINGVVKAAKKFNREVLVDMIAVRDLQKRAVELDKLGVDYLCVHTAFDEQNSNHNPLDELKLLLELDLKCNIAVAGGLNLQTVEKLKNTRTDIVIVGGSLTHAEDPKDMARKIKEQIA